MLNMPETTTTMTTTTNTEYRCSCRPYHIHFSFLCSENEEIFGALAAFFPHLSRPPHLQVVSVLVCIKMYDMSPFLHQPHHINKLIQLSTVTAKSSTEWLGRSEELNWQTYLFLLNGSLRTKISLASPTVYVRTYTMHEMMRMSAMRMGGTLISSIIKWINFARILLVKHVRDLPVQSILITMLIGVLCPSLLGIMRTKSGRTHIQQMKFKLSFSKCVDLWTFLVSWWQPSWEGGDKLSYNYSFSH